VDLCEDRVWLDDFRAGRSPALERVFRSYGPYVLSILRRGFRTAQGGNVHGILDVEAQHELMQEVFVRALGPVLRGKYDGVRPYAAFLRAIVGNVMLEDARKRSNQLERSAGREPTEDEIQQMDHWSPGTPLPDQAVLAQEQQQLVRDYLGTLPPETQRFIQVRYSEGASQRDAADTLGLGRQTVRTMEKAVRDGLKAFAQSWQRATKKSGANPEV